MIQRVISVSVLMGLATAAASALPCGGPCEWSGEAISNGSYTPYGNLPEDALFRIEGVNHGPWACWALAKWTGIEPTCPTPGCTCEWTDVTVSLRQDNTAATTNGLVHVYVCDDALDPTSSHVYSDWGTSVTGTLVGTYDFVEISNGFLDVYGIGTAGVLTSAADGTLVLAFVDGDDDVAATWAGATSNDYEGPTLQITGRCVPEPATLALLATAGPLAIAAVRRRRRRRERP